MFNCLSGPADTTNRTYDASITGPAARPVYVPTTVSESSGLPGDGPYRIRQQAGSKAGETRGFLFLLPAHRLRQHATERALGQNIHSIILPHY